jgi:hypothetical protein
MIHGCQQDCTLDYAVQSGASCFNHKFQVLQNHLCFSFNPTGYKSFGFRTDTDTSRNVDSISSLYCLAKGLSWRWWPLTMQRTYPWVRTNNWRCRWHVDNLFLWHFFAIVQY